MVRILPSVNNDRYQKSILRMRYIYIYIYIYEDNQYNWFKWRSAILLLANVSLELCLIKYQIFVRFYFLSLILIIGPNTCIKSMGLMVLTSGTKNKTKTAQLVK